mgnify:CR=1 FL=1
MLYLYLSIITASLPLRPSGALRYLCVFAASVPLQSPASISQRIHCFSASAASRFVIFTYHSFITLLCFKARITVYINKLLFFILYIKLILAYKLSSLSFFNLDYLESENSVRDHDFYCISHLSVHKCTAHR